METDIKTFAVWADVTVINDESVYSELIHSIPTDSVAAVERIVMKKDKLLSIGAWALFSEMMSRLGYDPVSFVIRYSRCGKPYISGPCSVHFNLSHSGQCVLCAISNKPVGCDIEIISNNRRLIAERFFTEKEVQQLNSVSVPDLRNELFYKFWTLKESFQKLTGLGFSLPLNSFSFDLTGEYPIVECPWGNFGYNFNVFNSSGYCFSVASYSIESVQLMNYDFLSGEIKQTG